MGGLGWPKRGGVGSAATGGHKKLMMKKCTWPANSGKDCIFFCMGDGSHAHVCMLI